MFGFFKKKKPVPTPKSAVVSPAAGIAFDEKLIAQFTDEHQSLLSLFGQIASHAENQQWPKTQQALKEFTTILRGHLLTENLKLYIYLTNSLKDDPESQELVRGFRQEMMQIGRAVNQFVSHYEKPIWTDTMKSDFLPELQAIGVVLVKRIENEEQTLYPLYMPESSYA